ncbi:MAG: mechanosensitive ion channel family protein [Actinomycetota bacterium]
MIAAQSETTTTTGAAEQEPSRPLTEWLIDVFNVDREGLTAGVLGDLIEPLLQVVLILVIAFLAVRLLRRGLRKVIERSKVNKPGLDFGDLSPVSTRKVQRMDALGAVGQSAIGVVIWILALLIVLGTTFGIDITPLLAGAGILGLAIGFGAQHLVNDIISGVFMLLEDQYGVGDVIDAGDAIGVVEGIGLRSTRVRDVTGTLWHIPNGEIRRVGNMSHGWSRALLDISVAYGTDLDHAAEVIKGVADDMYAEETYSGLFLAEPEIWGIESLSADSVDIRLVIKTEPGEQLAVARELRRRIKMALDHAQIEIPFPQRTVWIRQDDEETPEPPERDLSQPTAATGKAAAEEGAVGTDEDDAPTHDADADK